MRQNIDIAAHMVIDEGVPQAVRLINFSRRGFRLVVAHRLPLAQRLRIEVPGWPRLLGHLIWSDGIRLGGAFDPAPSRRLFDALSASIDPVAGAVPNPGRETTGPPHPSADGTRGRAAHRTTDLETS